MGRHQVFVMLRTVLLLGLLVLFVGSLLNGLLKEDPHHARPSGAKGTDPGMRVLLVGKGHERSHARLAIAPQQEGLLYCPDDKERWYVAVDPPHEIILLPQGHDGILVRIPARGYEQTWPVERLAFVSRHQPTDRQIEDLAMIEASNRQAVFALSVGGGRQYRGNLEVTLHGATGLHAVNALPIEAWLEGVLQAELPSSWPESAMHAQAIAARSYAFAKTWQRRRADTDALRYDLTDGGIDPTYHGTGSGSRPIDWAIADTHGKILTYYGSPFAAYYHAASGGHTAPIAHLRENPRTADGYHSIETVMPAQPDPWHARAMEALPEGEQRYGERTSEIKIATIKQRLDEAGYEHHAVFRIAADLSGGNHARRVTLQMTNNVPPVVMSGHEFRQLIGEDVIRSTLWSDDSPRMDFGTVYITTRGRGHGVGMPQISAYAMAKAGSNHQEILQRFYVESQIHQEW